MSKHQPNSSAILDELKKTIDNFGNSLTNIVKTTKQAYNPVEEMKPEYFNEKYSNEVKIPPIFRFSQKSFRYYFTVQEATELNTILGQVDYRSLVRFYPSVTTIISKTTPTPEAFQKIIADRGVDGYKQFMRERADYGTFIHIQIAEFIRSKNAEGKFNYNLNEIREKLESFIEEKHIDYNTQYWDQDAKNDLVCLMKFMFDYEVEPIFIEAVCTYTDPNSGLSFSGAIDLGCEMSISEKGFFGETYKTGDQKGEPKESYQKRRVKALIDFKSGKSGFFESHEIQLGMYKMAAEQSMGFVADKIFNISPKHWRGEEPTYNIKDQTESKAIFKIPYLLSAFYIDFEEPRQIQVVSGEITDATSLIEACKLQPAHEYAYKMSKVQNFIHKN